MTALEPSSDLGYAEFVATIEQAAQRLLAALGHSHLAWTNISNQLPGYRSTTAGNTPPEDYASILTDDAIKALDDIRRRATKILTDTAGMLEELVTWSTDDDPPPPKPLAINLDLWCISCQRAGICNPIFRGDLCRWCYAFNAAEHQRPPVKLVKLHDEGVRITDAIVAEALGRKRRKR